MALQKYQASKSRQQRDGAIVWYASYIGSPTIGKIVNCRVISLIGEPRVTVFVTGRYDSYLSLTTKFYFRGKVLNGLLTHEGNNIVCQHCYY